MQRLQKPLLFAMVLAGYLAAPGVYGALTYTVLFSFDGTNGAAPAAGLVQGKDGNFYGTAPNGGPSSNGIVFAISPDGSFFTNFYNFTGGTNGAGPVGGLIIGTDGNFYGTTSGGGTSNWGTVFQLTPHGTFKQLAQLSGINGSNPVVALVQAPDGSFYGGAKYGGPYPVTTQSGTGYGSIFRVTTNGALTTPVLFDSTNGANPTALVLAGDGNFYGATAWGGSISSFKLGFGTIFRLNPDGTFTNLYIFSGGNDGGFPFASLVQGNNGIFYGSTEAGGTNSIGTLFKITSGGQFQSLLSFPSSSMGSYPLAAMIQASDGNLYGTTYFGGNLSTTQRGTIYQLTPAGAFAQVLQFTGTNGVFVGANPQSPLVQGTDGNFYGTTLGGGVYNQGTVFRLSLPLAPVFKSIGRAGGTATLVWSSVAGQTNQLEYTTNLAQGIWNNVGYSMVATNGLMTGSDPAAADPVRLYRVMVQ
jgi:uncharacterized repeat protein (TIGR03803 family)